MKIFDIYIGKKYLSALFFSIFAFISIYIIIDAVERLSEYIDKGAPSHVILQYYLYYVPFIIILVMPISTLLASMFSVGQLSKHNEILALKTAGLSLYRILAPLFFLGLVISVFMIFFAEIVMPWANTQKAIIKRKYIDRMPNSIPSQIANLYFQEDNNQKVFIGYYNSHERLARKITILQLDGIFVRHRIDAEMMRWEKNNWVLLNGYERVFTDGKEEATAFAKMDMPDLRIGPDELSEVQKDPEEMSFQELQQFIQEVKKNGGDPDRWLVDLYLKISFPFANFVILLFGAPLAAGRIRSTGAFGVAVSITACFFYFGAVKVGQTLGQVGTLPPMIAAWLGNILFALAGFWIFAKTPK